MQGAGARRVAMRGASLRRLAYPVLMSLSATLREFQGLSPQQWIERVTRTVPRVLAVVLIVAIAWELVQITWLLLEPKPDTTPITITPSATAMSAKPKSVDVPAIVNAHLFGVAQADAPQNAENAPPSQANLVLTAVFAASDPAKGMAIIGESAQNAEVYAVGAAIRPGIRLNQVFFDRVVIDRNGQLETLALPKELTAGIINRPAPAQNPMVDNIRRIAETNPAAFAEIIRPQPVFANGVQRGYRVYPGRNRQQFARLGLMPGDLVLAVNGTPLDDPQRAPEIFNTMGSADRVTVSVERNGQTQDLTLNFAQVSLPDPNAPPDPRPIDRPLKPIPPNED
jgi:general secretion pathway protein C